MEIDEFVQACEGMKDGETRTIESPDGGPLGVDSNVIGVALAVRYRRSFYVRIEGAKATVKRGD